MSIRTTDLEKIFGTAISDVNVASVNGDSVHSAWTVGGAHQLSIGGAAAQVRATKATAQVSIDGSKATSGAILVGDYYQANSIVGSTVAGAEVAYYGGISSDTISLQGATDTVYFGKSDGNDTVSGFTATADKIKLYENAFADLKTAGYVSVTGTDDLTIKTGSNSSVVLKDAIGSATAVYLKDKDGTDLGIYATSLSSGASFTYDATKSALENTMFIGGSATNDALSFAGYTEDLDIYLDTAKNGNQIQGIENVTGGAGNSILRGNAADNIITAGTGATNVLWGGTKGSDSLKGNNNSVDDFWFGSADGKDSISTFKGAEDSLNLYNQKLSDLKASTTANDYVLTVGTSSNALSIEKSSSTVANTQITVKTSEGTKKIVFADTASNLATYKAGTDKYYGFGVSTLAGGTDGADMDVYLADTTKYDGIATVKGGTGVNMLRGNDKDNVMIGNGTFSNVLWGGVKGNDTLEGVAAAIDTFWYGAGEGKDSISGFIATEDSLNLYNLKLSQLTVSGDATADATFKVDSNNALTVNNIGADTKVTVNTAEGKKVIKLANNVAGAAGAVTYEDGIDKYYGLATGANVTTLQGALNGDLAGQNMDVYLADTTKYAGIKNIVGGTGTENYLRGDKNANVIVAKSGADTTNVLWGGVGGNDSMVGSTDAVDTFWFGAAEGQDTVTSFSTEDSLNLYNSKLSDVNVATTANANEIKFTVKNGDVVTANTLTVNGSVLDKVVNVATSEGAKKILVASAATSNTAAYDATIDAYYNTTKIDGSAVTTGIDIYLADTAKFKGVKDLIGGTGANNYLRGNDSDNTITASAGSTSNVLWGGKGTDIMQGADGAADQFWFGKNDGSDKIQYSDSMDSVMLYSAGLTTSGVTAAVSGGNLTLSITGTSDRLVIENWSSAGLNSFQFSDSTYSLSDDAKTWTKKA